MAALKLTIARRKELKARAHNLEPVAFYGRAGLSEEFLTSVRKALSDHQLIKVRFTAEKARRKELAAQIAAATGSALVTTVGHVALLYLEK